VLSTSTNAVTSTTGSIGTGAYAVAITPDGSYAYVSNCNGGKISPIPIATNVPGTGYSAGPVYGLVVVPDQSPVAALAPAAGLPGAAVTLDASASSDATGAIASYYWTFGDGNFATTTTPTTTHAYAAAGSYTAGVTLTNTTGTSTTRIFTGHTVSRNGTSAAVAQATVTISSLAPVAALAPAAGGQAMAPIAFDASASTGTISTYTWTFGDATGPVVTTVPTTTHRYPLDGTYTASVLVTGSGGTGGASQPVTVSTPFAFATAPPSAMTFPASLAGDSSVISAPIPLDVTNGAAAGWGISMTSTTWTTGGTTPFRFPLSATTVDTAPSAVCDALLGCTLGSNASSYPYVLPAGAVAPTATRMYVAGPGTGIGAITVTPTLRLNVPANARAGTYHSTLTVTLSSGP
jgi:PKD repeat protein